MIGDVTGIKLFKCTTHYFIHEMARMAVLVPWVAVEDQMNSAIQEFRTVPDTQ